MKARPILFSGPMVRALLNGRKTQTRRVVKLKHGYAVNGATIETLAEQPSVAEDACPYGKPGDLLWVRESFFSDDDTPSIYKADGDEEVYIKNHDLLCKHLSWKPSIHMPRWASRLTLEIVGVRVERLQEISRPDAAAEGVCLDLDKPLPDWCQRNRWPEENYRSLWETINGPGTWEANPWVWVLEFAVHRCNVDDLLKARAA